MIEVGLSNLKVDLMNDGTLIIREVPKNIFDKTYRVILENSNNYDVPVVRTFYEED